jgi:hypothetical protein
MKISRIEQLSNEAIDLSERLGPVLAELIAVVQDKNLLEKRRQFSGIKQSIKSLDAAGIPVPDELQQRLNDLDQILKDFEHAEQVLNKLIEKIPVLSHGIKGIFNTSISLGHRKVRASHSQGVEGETLIDQVFQIIKSRKDGIQKQELSELITFEERQLSNALYKLSKRGQIKNVRRGVYAIAE